MADKCLAFEMDDLKKAWEHMRLETVKDYGDRAYDHNLHTWDDGGRFLAKCKNCGGYVLVQKSEYHSTFGDDAYYTDYFPVKDAEEADLFNRKYDGFSIEKEFPERYLCRTNLNIHWSK